MMIKTTYLTSLTLSLGLSVGWLAPVAELRAQQLPQSPAVFKASTEQIHGPRQKVALALLRQILQQADLNEVDNLLACVRGNDDSIRYGRGLQSWGEADFKRAQKFFVLQSFATAGDNKQWLLLRPALKPYCQAFYGAHIFQYWLLTVADTDQATAPANLQKWRVMQQSSADALALHKVKTGKWLFAETHCRASACHSAWYELASAGLNLQFCSENGAHTQGEQIQRCR